MQCPFDRQKTILMKAAAKAFCLPKKSSGLWFHGDMRDNFYYASHLFAASCDLSVELPFDPDQAREIAVQMLSLVLDLQDTDPCSPMYGHWPLTIPTVLDESAPHVLPIELMSSLVVFFHNRYGKHMTDKLAQAFDQAMVHMYRSGFFRKELAMFNHHEAKYTSAKLIFGQRFKDPELMEDGRQSLLQIMKRLKEKGMPEYGCLPWFWHWIQSFTAAWMLTEDFTVKRELTELLDWLWIERSCFYLKGAWVGPRSRSCSYDLPRDSNVLFDYVQYGDFTLPEEIPRLEYAGLLFYEAPAEAKQIALHRKQPVERIRTIYPVGELEGERYHSYTYLSDKFAVGHVDRRVKEFDNEQLRYAVTFPIQNSNQANQAYFFHPGESFGGYGVDFRHQSGHMEVAARENSIAVLFPIPDDSSDQVIGVIPKGIWKVDQDRKALYGYTCEVFMVVHFKEPFEMLEHEDRIDISCRGRSNGVVIEVADHESPIFSSIHQLDDWIRLMEPGRPIWGGKPLQVSYSNIFGNKLILQA